MGSESVVPQYPSANPSAQVQSQAVDLKTEAATLGRGFEKSMRFFSSGEVGFSEASPLAIWTCGGCLQLLGLQGLTGHFPAHSRLRLHYLKLARTIVGLEAPLAPMSAAHQIKRAWQKAAALTDTRRWKPIHSQCNNPCALAVESTHIYTAVHSKPVRPIY